MSAPSGDRSRQLPAGYDFIRVLGEGGNGWVALARQQRLDRLVAIKTIHAHLDDEQTIARLRREGTAIAALRHPNVVIVYELTVSEIGISLVMEHVPGGDLRALLDGARLSGSRAVSLLCDTARALDHAGSRGIVHRDVKPANLLVGESAGKLADFGLARLPRTARSFRTISGAAAGTPAYMAPEQIENPDVETPAVDAYAFAVMAYEVITGSRPFPATDFAALIYAHLHGQPTPPWQITPDLPVPIGEILLAGMSKSPAGRPTPTQLADRLRTVTPAAWDQFFTVSRPRATARGPAAPTGGGGARTRPVGRPFAPPAVFARTPAPVRPPRMPARTAPGILPIRKRRKRVLAARLLGVLGGVAVGLIIAFLLIHR